MKDMRNRREVVALDTYIILFRSKLATLHDPKEWVSLLSFPSSGIFSIYTGAMFTFFKPSCGSS